ncbi:MAG: hypothetical protein ABIR55_02505 [Burkholderiaceae bacterium]
MKLLKKMAFSSCLVAMGLAGCGGGDPAPAPVLGGVAAVGTPIVGGTVSVACAGGSPVTTVTLAGGAWQVAMSGQTLPCALEISGGSVGGVANNTPYHSIAITLGNVNITPLTDLVVANLTGLAPGTWFGGIQSAALQAVTPGQVAAASQAVTNALGMTSTLAGNNPLTATFVAAHGNLLDDVLQALAAAGANHQSLLALAVNAGFSAPNGFNFTGAYASVVAGNGLQGNGGGTGTGTGTGSLRVGVTVAGQTSTIDIAGVAAPASQAEFCNDLSSDPTFAGIGASGGGTLTISSCSFSGNVGTIGANLSLQGLSVPYTITYTYL